MKSSEQHPQPERSQEIILSSQANGNSPTRLLCLEPAQPETKSEDTLVEFWHLLLFRKATVITIALLGAIAGALLTLNQVPVYQAVATIELQGPNDSLINHIGETDMSGSSYAADFLPTQTKLLQSRTLRERVMAKLKSEQKQPFERPDRLATWCRVLGIPWRGRPPQKTSIPAPVAVTVKGVEVSRLVEIRAESPDPKMASDFANRLASEYMDQNIESRWNAAQGASGWLSRQLGELRVKLQSSERELQQYGLASGLLYTDEKNTVQDERLRQLQAALSTAQADRIAREATYNVATTNPIEALPQILDNDRLSEEQMKLADLRRQLAELGSAYTPEHYKVVRVQAQITELEASVKKQRDDILRRIRIDYDSAMLREKILTGRYAEQATLVADLGNKAIYYNVLKQEVETTRHLYDTLLQRVKEFSVASALRASNVHVVDEARPPSLPYKPDMFRNMAMGLVSGLMLAGGYVLVRDRVDRSIKAPGESCFHLKLPELGVIPTNVPGMETKTHFGNGSMVSLGVSKNGSSNSKPDRVELVTWQDKTSPVAESFRNTLASILFSQQNVDRPRVILISSPGRAEGKSTTASNLAIALAEIDQKVLLIDADIRRSGLHKIFDVSNSWGLSDLLREKTSLQDSPLEALSRKTDIEGLYVLPSGPGTLSISNLLYSGRMSELLRRTRQVFDTIIIDTPPILYVSDARILGRLVDAAVLVIRAGVTTRDAALAAKERLESDGVPVLGIVLNAWDLKSKSPYGYGYYGGGYYASNHSDEKGRAAWS